MSADLAALVKALEVLDLAITRVAAHTDAGTRELADLGDTTGLADMVALVQDYRRRLGDIERDLVLALSQAFAGKWTDGVLSDGRQFSLKRTSDRKAWDHDDWQRDARQAIVQEVAGPLASSTVQHVNLETGEVIRTTLGRVLQDAMTRVENVHSAGAPKTTALRALGLDPSDYCETVKGAWKFDTIAPSENTIQEN